MYKVEKEHALLLFSKSENSDWTLQWWPVGKYVLKHKQITKTIGSKYYRTIIFYIRESRTMLYFFSSIPKDGSDIHRLPAGSGGSQLCTLLGIFQCSWALLNTKYNCVILFLGKYIYIGYLFMLPKNFFHRLPLHDLSDKTELRALPPPL